VQLQPAETQAFDGRHLCRPIHLYSPETAA